MSDAQAVVAVLNELLQAESGGLGLRLGETQPFAARVSAEQLAAVRGCAGEAHEHIAWLSELIVSLRGVPALRPPDASTTDLHYLSVEVLLPPLIDNCQKLIESYAAAAGRVAGTLAATELVNRIRTRHERHQQALRNLQSATSAQ